MTLFRYEAFSTTGATSIGNIEAATLPAALSLLSQRNLRPYVLVPESQVTKISQLSFSFAALGLEWRVRFVRQLATLIAAGVTLDRSLLLMESQVNRASEKKIFESLLTNIRAGFPLSTALAKLDKLFKPDEIGLIRASEQTGSIAVVLDELATLLERRIELQGKITSALVYPAFLLALAPISLIIIATVLVPNLAPLFENSGTRMPFALGAMIWISQEFRDSGFVWMAIFILAGLLVYKICNTVATSAAWSSTSLRLPFWGPIKRKAESARICRTLGTLIKSGSPLQSAMQAVVDTVPSVQTKLQLEKARVGINTGKTLAESLKAVRAIDKMALQMVAIGEETNKLDTMLLYIANLEEKYVEQLIDRLMALLTPFLTILLGMLVGGIVMSIMRAILSINDLVGQ
jgi:general secretion pathway protein F